MAIITLTNNILIPSYKLRCSNLDKNAKKQFRVSSSATPTRSSSFQLNGNPCAEVHTTRRSGNYKPSHWDFDFIQPLDSQYKDERYLNRVSELVVQVKSLMVEKVSQAQLLDQLELIDDLQRLGLSFHFENEIKQILNCLYEEKYGKNFQPMKRDLYSTSLEFRLLRQHGYRVSQEVFDCFKNEKGDFKSSYGSDTKGLLQLYEASFMLTEGEDSLEQAKEFATVCLKKKVDEGLYHETENDDLLLLVGQALELPIHWRVPRPSVRLFIDAYGRRKDMNPVILELAILDFNSVQATSQEGLKHVSRWWRRTCLAEKLPFARDRLVECYFWTVGIFEPRQYEHQRIVGTKVNLFTTIIDDVFDVYGTLDELQLFTDTVRRWDIETIDQLPNYMQICYLALYNFVNEMAYDVLKETGFNIIPYLRKSWTDLIEVYLQEAKWYYSGYKPSLEEYLNNAWVSISGPVLLTHFYFLVTTSIDKEAVESLYKYHDIVRWSSTILRLADDLGTSMDEVKRGDIPKSVQCYMNERNAPEEEARQYVKYLIGETWKKLNKERVSSDSPFSKEYIALTVDLARMSQLMYQLYGDGHGIQVPQIRDRITESLFEPHVELSV